MIQYILGQVIKKLMNIGIVLKPLYFGLNKNYKTQNGVNLGKLNKEELAQLYAKADFGLVASMTNISLVPYEMIATGLPIIEFKEGSFSDFFPSDTAILIDFDPQTLFEKLIYYIEDGVKIKEMSDRALEFIKQFSWNKTAEQFYEIIENVKEKKDKVR